MIPKDYAYLGKTKQGWRVLEIYQDRFGYLNIIGYRPSHQDYFLARGYDPVNGNWSGGGVYDLDSRKEARDIIYKGRDGPYTLFDPYNEADVRFEYDAQYNWNHVDTEWLKKVNHRDTGFTTMHHSDFDYVTKHGYDNYPRTYSYTEKDFEEFKRDYRRSNAPKRTMNAKPAGRAVARPAVKKTAVRKPAVKKTAVKSAAKKTVAKPVKKAVAKKSAPKKASAKKPAVKKAVAKKPVAKKKPATKKVR